MKLEILSKKFADKSTESIIIKSFEYFITINKEKYENLPKKENGKKDLSSILSEMSEYIEVGLKKQYSMNFNVLISAEPIYCLKYERNCVLILKIEEYEVLVFKTPYICIPNKFIKKAVDKEKIETHYSNLIKTIGKDDNYKVLDFYIKEKNDLSGISNINENSMKELLFKNIAYCNEEYGTSDKNYLSYLSQSIQYDLGEIFNDFSFGVIISKSHFFSQSFIASSNLFYRAKIHENNGYFEVEKSHNNETKESTNINNDYKNDNDLNNNQNSFNNSNTKEYIDVKVKKLKDVEIMIYHKKALFESILSSIVTGRFKNVELKHLFIFVSVFIFFIIVGFCKGNLEEYQNKELNWFEENVCVNKSTYISSIGVMFILIVLSGVLKKKMEKKKKSE